MGSSNEIQCAIHGPQERTYVCQHIVETLRDGQPRGFYYGGDDPNGRGDAWCTACDEMLRAAGGEWHEAIEERAGIRLLCGVCYDEAKRVNGL